MKIAIILLPTLRITTPVHPHARTHAHAFREWGWKHLTFYFLLKTTSTAVAVCRLCVIIIGFSLLFYNYPARAFLYSIYVCFLVLYFCFIFCVFCLFPIFVQIYRTLSPGGNPTVVNKCYISYHISYYIISYRILSYRIISYHIISYRIVSYHTIKSIIPRVTRCVASRLSSDVTSLF